MARENQVHPLLGITRRENMVSLGNQLRGGINECSTLS